MSVEVADTRSPLRPEPAQPSPASLPAPGLWRLVAWIAGVFSVLIATGMGLSYLRIKTDAPLSSPQLKQLKETLRANPMDEPTKQQIRTLDLQLRQYYFRHLSQSGTGVYLLLGGALVFVLAVTRSRSGQRELPSLKLKPDATAGMHRAARVARWSVAACGSTVGIFLFLLSLRLITALPSDPAGLDKLLGGDSASAAVTDAATLDELRRNWPRFLGVNAGRSLFTNAPANWDAASGTAILWKTPVPVHGFNSPITWNDRIFFSGGEPGKLEVVCLNAVTGQIVWRQPVANVPGSPTGSLDIPESTGYAAPTMATDGRRVYCIFANGDVAAFTLEGRMVWSKAFGVLKNPYGHATSLATWQDRLILQLDQGESEENKSRICAVDGRTGQIVWQRPRKVGGSWASPLVIEAAGKAQVIALAVPWLIAYAATDGTELWRADCLNGEVTPSPIFANGLLYVASPSEKLMAIRPDGQGDVTKTHIVWTAEDNVPDVTSPASNGELVFTVTTAGMLTTFDAKDGKRLWEHDFEMECHASPAISGNRLYLFSQKGTAVVVEAAREFKELFRTEMGDSFHASPAFVRDNLILRGVSNIWCVGASPGKVAQTQ